MGGPLPAHAAGGQSFRDFLRARARSVSDEAWQRTAAFSEAPTTTTKTQCLGHGHANEGHDGRHGEYVKATLPRAGPPDPSHAPSG